MAVGVAQFQGTALPMMALVVVLIFMSPIQIMLSPWARMYSLGIMLCGIAAYLCVSALSRSGLLQYLLWIAWGVVAGAGMLTHHFILFFLAGQIVFSLAYVTVSGFPGFPEIARKLMPIALGSAVATVVYSPWIPVIIDQFREVREYFWIPPLTIDRVLGSLNAWMFGTDDFSWRTPSSLLTGIASVLLICIAIWRRPVVSLAFAVPAILPWILCLAVSVMSGRSMLQERYLVFGHASVLVLIALGCVTCKDTRVGLGLAGILVFAGIINIAGQPYPLGIQRDCFADAIETIARNDSSANPRPIFVPWPADVNRAKCLLAAGGHADRPVRVLVAPMRRGHVGHILALQSEEIVWKPWACCDRWNEVWVIVESRHESAPATFGGACVNKVIHCNAKCRVQYSVLLADTSNERNR